MSVLRKSIYTFLIKRDGIFLVYNSARNSFLRVNEDVFDFIENLNHDAAQSFHEEERELLNDLAARGIVSTADDDANTAETLKIKYLTSVFSKELLSLTIAPTISCNLRCPYCFEKDKMPDRIAKETCDQIVTFIRNHKYSKALRIVWFGGEPLLCVDEIQYLLKKFQDEELPEIKNQEIITNGVLLKGRNLELFDKFKINRIQVTLDGNEEHHNKKRIWPNGNGTYDEILNNLEEFIKKYPSIEIAIRINIDKENSDDFFSIRKMFRAKYPSKRNLMIYPGILKDCGVIDKKSVFFCNSDIVNLYGRFMKEGIHVPYPRHCYLGCGANHLSNYVIGPKGELYKCWQDLGIKDRVIGDVFSDKFYNQPLLSKYLLHGSHVMNQQCMECPILPICDNNCANDRLDNFYKGGRHELCSAYKDDDYRALKDRLFFIYMNYVKSKTK